MSNVKDVRQKPVTIELGNKKWQLLYDLNAFAELEEMYGSVEKAMDELEKGTLKAIRAILWAGLVHQDETLTQKEVGKLITLDKLESVSIAMSKALEISLPKPEQANPNKQDQ
jgi:hypothetical protein